MICVGILAALLVNVALPATAWRSMFAIAAAPAALLGLGGWIGEVNLTSICGQGGGQRHLTLAANVTPA